MKSLQQLLFRVLGGLLVFGLAVFGMSGEGLAETPAEAGDDPGEIEGATNGAMSEGVLVEPEFEPEGEPLKEKAEAPDLDGVPERLTVGDVLIWIPRAALFLPYLVSELLIRQPIGLLARTVEKYHLVGYYLHYTTFGERGAASLHGGITPTLQLDTAAQPRFGVQVFANNVGVPGNEYQFGADTNFRRNVTLDGRAKYRLAEDLFAGPRFRFERRDDLRFFGTGSRTRDADETRFERTRVLARLEGRLEPEIPGIAGRVGVTVSDNEFRCTSDTPDVCGADSLPNTADDRLPIDEEGGAVAFTSGYQLVETSAEAFWDTRRERPAPGTGFRFTVDGRWGHGVGHSAADVHLVGIGSEAAAFLDIWNQRVIGLRVRGELAEPVGGRLIPFPELVRMGGRETMRGFTDGRFHGRSGAVGTLEYRYPVWSFLDGTIFVEAGNAFGRAFEDFAFEALRGAAGFGFRTIQRRNVSLDAIIAVGTTRFDADRFGVDTVRLSAGTNWGF